MSRLGRVNFKNEAPGQNRNTALFSGLTIGVGFGHSSNDNESTTIVTLGFCIQLKLSSKLDSLGFIQI